jgi:8-oxo-dGTP pyrophosphatase MutT (NUDIX family)
MVAGSILPVAIHNNKLFFLFGKENSMEDSAKGWSDFGGGVENGETTFQTAVREGSEEMTGFLGNSNEIKNLIKKNGGFYEIIHNTYHVHIFLIDYDDNLPKYYNQNHRFLWDKMDNIILNKSKLFEKIEINWFSIQDMKKRIKEFRNFYQDIVRLFLSKKENIYRFLLSKSKKRKLNKSIKKSIQKRRNKTMKKYNK